MRLHEKLYEVLQPLVVTARAEDVISVLGRVIQLWPDFAVVHNDLGVIYYNNGEKEKAVAHYELAVRHQPENIIFQKNLADFFYVEQGRVEEALKIYREILEKHPEDIETLFVTGHICVSLRRFEDAKVFYKKVLELEPWNSEVRENLAKLEDMDSHKTATDSPDRMYAEIQRKIEKNHHQEAIQDLIKMIQLWPACAGVAHNDLGVLYYSTGEKDKALEHYEQAVQHQPDNITFKKNLADFYLVEKGYFEDALRIYVNILKRDPEDIETLIASGRICDALQKPDDAKIFYKRVLEIEPWNSTAMAMLNNPANESF